jgi:hypothetical protein
MYLQQKCTTPEITCTLQNKHYTEAFQSFVCIMSILSLSLTAITETEVVDCFMQIRFEVLPVVIMKTPSSGLTEVCWHFIDTYCYVHHEGIQWGQQVPVKHWYTSTGMHGITCHTTYSLLHTQGWLKKPRHFMGKFNSERYKGSGYHWDWTTY